MKLALQAITREVMWLEDPASLSEACRLVSAAVMAASRAPWLHALQEDTNLLPHLLWIVQNTLNETLLERCVRSRPAPTHLPNGWSILCHYLADVASLSYSNCFLR